MKNTENLHYLIGSLILIFGIVLMILGIRNGEALVVMQKAIKICMECIGIG